MSIVIVVYGIIKTGYIFLNKYPKPKRRYTSVQQYFNMSMTKQKVSIIIRIRILK